MEETPRGVFCRAAGSDKTDWIGVAVWIRHVLLLMLVTGAINCGAVQPAEPGAATADDPAPAMVDTVLPEWETIAILGGSATRDRGVDIRLRVTIDPDGTVGDIETVASDHLLFERMARKAAWSSVYRPARRGGEPTRGTLDLIYTFASAVAVCSDSSAVACAELGGAPFLRDPATTPDPTVSYERDGTVFFGDMSESAYRALRRFFAEPEHRGEDIGHVAAVALSTAIDAVPLEQRLVWVVRGRRDTATAEHPYGKNTYFFEIVEGDWQLTRIGGHP